MLQVEMTASVRNDKGKGAMRRLRAQGQTPGVMYGRGEEALPIQLESKILMKQLLEVYRKNTVVTMKIDNGDVKSVLIKDVQTDPVKDTLVHADFLEIDLEAVRVFSVPLQLTGTSKGVDLGGILNVNITKIDIKGKPLDVPDEFTVDITALAIGDSIKVSDIEMSDKVELVTSGDAVCVVVDKPGGAKVEAEEETEE